jgi:hypothetical protein
MKKYFCSHRHIRETLTTYSVAAAVENHLMTTFSENRIYWCIIKSDLQAKGKPDVYKRADKPSECIFIETDRGSDASLIHKVFSFLHRMIGFSNI